jgi:Leucine Rich Repeat (LRR) protein
VWEQSIVTEKQERRPFQFSLRSLLVFVLLVSIGMSWLGVKIGRARKQREAVEAIEKAGGSAGYEDFTNTSVPNWARAVFGDDFFFSVRAVGASDPNFGDEEAAYLKELTSLTALSLSYTQVTDAGLMYLKGLTSLSFLDLDDTQVTDAGLVHLKELTDLSTLYLAHTQVTDAGLEHLKRMTSLDLLRLNGTHVTTQGVDDLRKALPNCDISF